MTRFTSAQFLLALKVIVLITIALLFFDRTLMKMDPDLGWHIRTGEWIVEHQDVPRQDLYSYTLPEHEWVEHEWLLDVVFYAFSSQGAWHLIVLAFFLFAFIPFAWWLTRVKDMLGLFLVTLSAYVALAMVGVRPQILTFFFLFLLYRFLFRTPPLHPKWNAVLFILPLFFFLWANCHGGFTMGLALWGITISAGLVERFIKKDPVADRRVFFEIAAYAASAIATLLTPYGISLWGEVLSTVSAPILSVISEWQSSLVVWQISVPILIGCALVLITFSGKQFSLRAHAAALFFFTFALLHARMMLPFFVVSMEMIILSTSFLLRGSSGDRDPAGNSVVSVLSFVLCVLITLTLVLGIRSPDTVDPYTPPFAAAHALRSYCMHTACGPIYNDFNAGGALISVSPEQKIFSAGYMPHWTGHDGYSPTEDAVALASDHPETYPAIFERYGVRVAIVPLPLSIQPTPEDRVSSIMNRMIIPTFLRMQFISTPEPEGNLANHLSRDGWCLLYRDRQETIYVHPDDCAERNMVRIPLIP